MPASCPPSELSERTDFPPPAGKYMSAEQMLETSRGSTGNKAPSRANRSADAMLAMASVYGLQAKFAPRGLSLNERHQRFALLDNVGAKLGCINAADVPGRVNRFGWNEQDIA